MQAEIGAFWKILAQQSVGVLVRAALPWAVRIAEIDLNASVDLQACVLSHLSSLIPSQRPTQLLRQGDDLIPYVSASAAAPRIPSASPAWWCATPDPRSRTDQAHLRWSAFFPA